MRKFKHKLLLVFLAIFVILAGTVSSYNIIAAINSNSIQLKNFKENLIKDYDANVRNQVESAYSLLNYAYEKYQSGELSEAEAKSLGGELIKELRYGESGYFWIDDTEGNLVAHPITPDAEGSNRLEIQDPDGTYLIKNILSAADNDGFSEYMWEKPGTEGLVKKRVYSKLFEPWDYVVSTGNYLDDIDSIVAETEQYYKQEMIKNVRNQLIIIGILLLAAGIIAYIFSNRVSKHIEAISAHVKRIANNDLSAEDLAITAKDEIGQLSKGVNGMAANLRKIIQDVVKASDEVSSHSEELNQSSNEVTEGTSQVASTMQELSSGSETQASSASDLSEAMNEFVEYIRIANENSGQVSNLSEEVLCLTSEGNKAMTTSIQQMNTIDQIVKRAVEKVQGLDKQSQEIAKLISVIKEIADQTNLLALNAAIEAARAGEHGKGFSVVAEEVRKLAEQVSHSVSDITMIVTGIKDESNDVVISLQNGYGEVTKGTEQMRVTEGTFHQINGAVTDMVNRLQAVTQQLSQITENSTKVSQSIEDIAAISEESAAGIEQIAASIQQTNSSMEEVTGSSKRLSELADGLNDMVKVFKI